MQFIYLHIHNFKSIRDLEIRDTDRVSILMGKNDTGKTSVLNTVCAVRGCYQTQEQDFNEKRQTIHIDAAFSIEEGDLEQSRRRGIVGQYRCYDVWERVFGEWLPFLQDGELCFTLHVNLDGRVQYEDLYRKNSPHIPMVLPHIHRITAERELNQPQNDLLMFQEDEESRWLRSGIYIFEGVKKCNHCFQHIDLINKKKPEELTVSETARLPEYKTYRLNLSEFSRKVNENLYKNSGYEEIQYTLNYDMDQLFSVEVTAHNLQKGSVKPVELMGKGMGSIYILSLLETYIGEQNRIPSIIVMENPEIFFHPQLQKTRSEILYRLSEKDQVIFKTHSPDLLFNFSIRQIRQVVPDEERYSAVRKKADLGETLDDLGYGANDLLNVNFVSTVEGKQDKSCLLPFPEKYYSEIHDSEGKSSRIFTTTTNSCTNIKTYANLKHTNRVCLRDQFLMIRDRDSKDPEELASQLCRYYDERSLEDVDRPPKVIRRNVLMLKYYSSENYFLNPSIMAKLGIVESEEAFYKALYDKRREYLYRIQSGQQLEEIMGRDSISYQDMREYMEETKTYMRGHNLYDMFYGPFRKREQEILKAYIDMAPSEELEDILEAADRFIYFDSRKKEDAIADK